MPDDTDMVRLVFNFQSVCDFDSDLDEVPSQPITATPNPNVKLGYCDQYSSPVISCLSVMSFPQRFAVNYDRYVCTDPFLFFRFLTF